MAFADDARRFGQYMWQGPTTLPKTFQLEWRLVTVRWVGILVMTPGLLLAGLSASSLQAAYGVLAFAVIYNLIIQLNVSSHPRLFASGYITAMGDTMLTIGMIKIAGGFNSPFYYLLFTVTIAEAMRFGYRPALANVAIVIVLDLVEVYTTPATLDATFIIRSGFLLMTCLLAGYLRDQTQRAERALEERLRQANLLNEATATLGASLEFEPALRAAAAAACHLFGGARANLQTAKGLGYATDNPLAMVDYVEPGHEQDGQQSDLATFGSQYTTASDGNVRQLIHRQLPGGQQVLALRLALPNRTTSLATLALSLPPGQRPPSLDPDILDSFVERTSLALENASLYRTLASRTDDLQRAYSDLAIAHQELLGVDEMKTGFLANVSHELRTPLSSIRSFSELLLSYDNDPEVQTEFLQIINSESERLTRLVNDVLDITRLRPGRWTGI